MRIHGSNTVSVLIFVGWVQPFMVASCPHVLGAHVTPAPRGECVRNVIMHGPAARSLSTAADLGRRSQRTKIRKIQGPRAWALALVGGGPRQSRRVRALVLR